MRPDSTRLIVNNFRAQVVAVHRCTLLLAARVGEQTFVVHHPRAATCAPLGHDILARVCGRNDTGDGETERQARDAWAQEACHASQNTENARIVTVFRLRTETKLMRLDWWQ